MCTGEVQVRPKQGQAQPLLNHGIYLPDCACAGKRFACHARVSARRRSSFVWEERREQRERAFLWHTWISGRLIIIFTFWLKILSNLRSNPKSWILSVCCEQFVTGAGGTKKRKKGVKRGLLSWKQCLSTYMHRTNISRGGVYGSSIRRTVRAQSRMGWGEGVKIAYWCFLKINNVMKNIIVIEWHLDSRGHLSSACRLTSPH